MKCVHLFDKFIAARHSDITADFYADHDLAEHALPNEVEEGTCAQSSHFSCRNEQNLEESDIVLKFLSPGHFIRNNVMKCGQADDIRLGWWRLGFQHRSVQVKVTRWLRHMLLLSDGDNGDQGR